MFNHNRFCIFFENLRKTQANDKYQKYPKKIQKNITKKNYILEKFLLSIKIQLSKLVGLQI